MQRLMLDISQNAGIDIGRFYLVVEAVQRLASQQPDRVNRQLR